MDELTEHLLSWINWRYDGEPEPGERVVSVEECPAARAETVPLRHATLPPAVYRLARLVDGRAVACALTRDLSYGNDREFSILQIDSKGNRGESIFERLADGSWSMVEGDNL